MTNDERNPNAEIRIEMPKPQSLPERLTLINTVALARCTQTRRVGKLFQQFFPISQIRLLCAGAAFVLLAATRVAAVQVSSQSIENGLLKLEFVPGTNGYSSANIYARQDRDWTLVAVWKPLFQIATA